MKEMIDQETIDNSNTKTDMTEEVKLLMEAKSEVSELRMQLKMQERDLSELNNFKARALSAESKIAEISTEYDSLKLINDDTDALRDALTDAEATNRALLDDITELKWACLSLQAAGMPAIDGKIISMATVQKFFGKEYSPEKTFKIKVWGFELSHQAGSQEVLIKKL
jgi:chromosome segregation ATPase